MSESIAPEEKHDFFSRLRRGRSKPNLKSQSSFRLGTPNSAVGPDQGSLPTPSLSLSFDPERETKQSFAGDTSISRFLTTSNGTPIPRPAFPSTLTPPPRSAPTFAPATPVKHSAPATDAAPITPPSTKRTYTLTNGVAKRNLDMEWTSVNELQTRIMTEMHEKSLLLSKYESLSMAHLALQSQLSGAKGQLERAHKPQKAPSPPVPPPAPVVAPVPAPVVIPKADASTQTVTLVKATRDTGVFVNIPDPTPAPAPIPVPVPVPAPAPAVKTPPRSPPREADTAAFARLDDRLTAAHLSLRQHEATIEALRRQNLDLKRSISTSTRGPVQTTDDIFREEMGKLAFELQNWIMNNFRRLKVDFTKVEPGSPTEREVELAVGKGWRDRYAGVSGTTKIAFLQALAAGRCMVIWEEDLFYGLPETGEFAMVRRAWETLKAPNEDAASWRAYTVALLLSQQTTPTSPIAQQTHAQTTALAASIDALLCAVTNAQPASQTSNTSSPSALKLTTPTTVRRADLTAILGRLVATARLFRSQRAAFAFDLSRAPGQVDALVDGRVRLDPDAMEDLQGADDDDDVDGAPPGGAGLRPGKHVELVVWPSVSKIADPDADDAVRTVVSKAKVLCRSSKVAA